MAVASVSAGPLSPPLLEETIGACLERIAGVHAGREALVDVATGRRWTYGELNAAVDRLALGLLGRGIAAGDRVGLWATNCPEWTQVQLATAKVGAILVNINPAYRTHELAYALNQSGCRLLIAETEVKGSSYVEMVASIRGEVTSLEDAIYLCTRAWDELATDEGGDALRVRMAELSPADPINIQYTSGTTGFPKGATLTHRNILNNGYFTTELQGFTFRDRLCIRKLFGICVHHRAHILPNRLTFCVQQIGKNRSGIITTFSSQRSTFIFICGANEPLC